ncbi:polysaccharide lyase 6 family protein [Candidatus Entotheonella palauensis]|nr:polysaccharide lyase 6 family protein [Candidatus Entotheonella palauensis]
MKMLKGCLVACLLLATTVPHGEAVQPRTVLVSTVAELKTAVQQARAGTIIDLADGAYTLDRPLMITGQGTQRHPILIRAKNLGQARIVGTATLHIRDAAWVIVDGLTLAPVLKTRHAGVQVTHSAHVQLSRLSFHFQEPLGRRAPMAHWLSFHATRHSRVHHSRFGPRVGIGLDIEVRKPSQHIRIDHNYFYDRETHGRNGAETIRIDGGRGHRWDAYTVIEHNLFDRCSGEGEIISIKSHRNTVRANTFRESFGAVTIRSGDYNRITGNFFLAFTEPMAFGVRIHGLHNRVINNYMYGLERCIISSWGDTHIPYIDSTLREAMTDEDNWNVHEARYRASYDNTIAFNTMVQCGAAFTWFKRRLSRLDRREPRNAGRTASLPPARWTVANNLVVNAQQFAAGFVSGEMGSGETVESVTENDFQWSGNLIFHDQGKVDFGPGRTFSTRQWNDMDPKLIPSPHRGVFRLSKESPAIDRATGHVDDVTRDIEGQVRQHPKDIGADEYHPGSAGPLRPLTANEVGPLSGTQPSVAAPSISRESHPVPHQTDKR